MTSPYIGTPKLRLPILFTINSSISTLGCGRHRQWVRLAPTQRPMLAGLSTTDAEGRSASLVLTTLRISDGWGFASSLASV